MYIQFYTIFGRSLILGKFTINNKKYTFLTKSSLTKAEALEKFFTGYQDACKKLVNNSIVIKVKEEPAYTYTIEKLDHSRTLRVINQYREDANNTYNEFVSIPYALIM